MKNRNIYTTVPNIGRDLVAKVEELVLHFIQLSKLYGNMGKLGDQVIRVYLSINNLLEGTVLFAQQYLEDWKLLTNHFQTVSPNIKKYQKSGMMIPDNLDGNLFTILYASSPSHSR